MLGSVTYTKGVIGVKFVILHQRWNFPVDDSLERKESTNKNWVANLERLSIINLALEAARRQRDAP